MKYFHRDALQFLQELPANNNKAWLDANKGRYQQALEAPFRRFVADFIQELRPLIPDLQTTAEACIFRIYKDVRFSQDKDPYKNWVSAMISKGGRKDKTTPGAYIQFSGEDVRLYSGCFELSSKQLESIRSSIFSNLEQFTSLVEDPTFKATFTGVRGETQKRIPKPYAAVAEKQPLLQNKSFYYYKKYPAATALQDDFLKTLVEDYKSCISLNAFFSHALAAESVQL